VSNSTKKKKLREEFKQKIDAFTFNDLMVKSKNLARSFDQEIVETLKTDAFFGRFIVSFYPFGNEPQINIELDTQSEPYQVAYVRIVDWSKREMVSAQARRDQPGQWEEFAVSSGHKIFQPNGAQSICSPKQVAAILVPGLAFSPTGERLGRGAGFYDRFLIQYPEALRVGVAFEEQIVKNIPCDPWDEKVDIILTDRGVLEVNEMKLLGEWRTQGKVLRR